MSKLERYEMTFHRHGLPTVQHKAGLGGLVYLLKHLEGRELPQEERVEFEVSKDELRLALTSESLTRLMSELYQNMTVVRTSRSKPKGEYWEEERELSNGKTEKIFKYKDSRPRGGWLFEGLKPGAEQAIAAGEDDWHKLWQDSLWQTFRGIPATRKVFDTDKGKEKVVKDFWKAFEKKEKGKPVTLDIASTIYVGAQAQNPEGIGFEGSPDEVFLLHFAQVLAQPYKVVGVDSQGGTYWPGVIWVFLEPGNLKRFVKKCKGFLAGRKVGDPDFRLRSRVTLPQEAALGILSDEALKLTLEDAGELAFDGALCTHLNKEGNNINLYAASYVPYEQNLISDYREVVLSIQSYPVRKLCLQNLLDGKPLYRGASKLLSYLPKEAAVPLSGLGNSISRDSKTILEKVEQ